MAKYFTSDLHLGHKRLAEHRGFTDLETHDRAVIDSFSHLTENDRLYIVGDVVWDKKSLVHLSGLKPSLTLVMGNHDNLKVNDYVKYFNRLKGAVEFGGMIVTHIPVHPNELNRYKANIHGHLHKDTDQKQIEDPRYINVNWDFHRGPISGEAIINQQNKVWTR